MTEGSFGCPEVNLAAAGMGLSISVTKGMPGRIGLFELHDQ